MITRIFTDVPPDDLAMIANAIAVDNGTFTQQTQEDGNLTLFAEYPGDSRPERQPDPGARQFAWMPIARDEIGIAEGRGDLRISQYFTTTTLGPQPSSVPWCSAFVNFCVTRGGATGTNSALARSWLTCGPNATSLLPGCIVVLSRGSPALGHVGFYIGDDGQGAPARRQSAQCGKYFELSQGEHLGSTDSEFGSPTCSSAGAIREPREWLQSRRDSCTAPRDGHACH